MGISIPKFRLDEKIVLFAIILNHFSFWPSVAFNTRDSSDIEMAMLSGVVIVIFTLFRYRRKYKDLMRFEGWQPLLLWITYGVVLSLFLTENVGSNVLRSGYLTSVLLASYCIYWMIKQKVIRINYVIVGWVGIAFVLSLLAIAQFMLSSFSDVSLVRDRYGVGTFAFPRVHVFALEPLFFANWLLAPLLTGLHMYTKNPRRVYFVITTVIVVAFILTLSRGAFYGAAAGILFLVVSSRSPVYIKRVSKPLVAAFLGAMLLVGSASAYQNGGFLNGVGRFLDHATLGVFNSAGANNVEPEIVETKKGVIEQSFAPSRKKDDQGVVEASTKVRVETNEYGIDILTDTPANFIFGVGLFRYGEEVSARTVDILQSDKIVSNNQLLDVLVETGLVGAFLWVVFFYRLRGVIRKQSPVMIAVSIAVVVQFLTFSGYFLIPFWVILAILVSSRGRKDIAYE